MSVCLFIDIILITFSPSENATVVTKEKTLRKNVTPEGDRIQAAPSKLTCKDIFTDTAVLSHLSFVFACSEKAATRFELWRFCDNGMLEGIHWCVEEAFYSDFAFGTQA